MTWQGWRLPQLLELCAKGWTASRIAQALGVTRNAVIGARHRNGLSLTKEQDLTRRATLKFKANRARQATKFQFGKAKSPTRQPKKGPGRAHSSLSALAPPPLPDPPPHERVPFLERKPRLQCAWICDDGQCCGRTTIGGSWCSSHYRIVFRPVPMRVAPWDTRWKPYNHG